VARRDKSLGAGGKFPVHIMILLLVSAVLLFASTVVVEHYEPSVMCTPLWHPISCNTFLAYGIYAAPALPTLIAFALILVAIMVGVVSSVK
jgi:hypothetical protein